MRLPKTNRNATLGLTFHGQQLTLLGYDKANRNILFSEQVTLSNQIEFLANGKITPLDELTNTLKTLVKIHQIYNYPIAVSLPYTLAIRKTIQMVPGLNISEQEKEIRENFAEYFPGIEETLAIDFNSLKSNIKQDEILLVAARQTTIQQLTDLITIAGLKLRIVDLDIYSKIRATHSLDPSTHNKILFDYTPPELQVIFSNKNQQILVENAEIKSKNQLSEFILNYLKKHLLDKNLSLFDFYLSCSAEDINSVQNDISNFLNQEIKLINSLNANLINASLLSAFGLTIREFPKW